MDQIKITFERVTGVKVTYPDGAFSQSRSMTDILLFKILEKLEEVRCGLIDIEGKLP